MQHCKKDRTFHIKPESSFAQQAFNHRLDRQLFPESFKDRGWAYLLGLAAISLLPERINKAFSEYLLRERIST
ncbi:MAG: hypothetical protein MJE63_30650 [Proteobacteria bacterium]|nr:hypothetical protein [Pseudomonadota bacterium]